ncbi:MAG: peptide-methionine (R)-S-oxide reductase MsrB [Spirochaetaceae bacterium]|nr:peptide-methionine (R)-S-oxide reductase MsrB [Spirochaetaceae bacterium]
MEGKDARTDKEWKEVLTREQYRGLRKHGTERAFTGKYWNTKTPGTYVCAGCGAPLFESAVKYDSGTGWPSFFQPISDQAVETDSDRSLGMARTEVHCAHCGGHLGHVFPDGPQPTGVRYCINSISLELRPEEER